MDNKKPFPFEVCKECCAGGGGEGGNIVIDNAMSDESENTVQNKVIKAYVDDTVKTYVETAILGGEW